MVSSTGEPAVLLVTEAQRKEGGLLELGGVFPLGPIAQAHQRLREPDHLERSLPHIVGLLGVQHQDPVCHFGLRHYQRQHRSRAQTPECREAMVAVGCVIRAVFPPHHHDRVHVSSQLLHRPRQASDVRLGKVPLVRGRLDLLHRQRRDDLP